MIDPAQCGLAGRPVKALTWLVVVAIAFALLSIHLFEQGLRDIDNRSRFVVIPWIALWVCALRPDIRWLWGGALLMAFGGGLSLSDRRYRVAAGARRVPAGVPAE